MRADQIQARAVAKVVLVALFWAGLAVLFAIALLHTRTTLQWVAAAIFLALALDPAVGLIQRAWPGQGLMPSTAGLPADRPRHRRPGAQAPPLRS